MNSDDEVIALLVDEPVNTAKNDLLENTGAQRLIREANGRVCLEPVKTQAEFDRMAKDTGCFRRGRAIRDPKTFEVIGYEMEEVSPGLLAVSG